MYGQERIINSLKEELNNSSNFIILAGQRGQGRRTICKYIAYYKGMDYQEINDLKMDNIRSIIDEAYKKVNPIVYCIVTNDKVPMQVQNTILKFTEDPPANSIIFLCVRDLSTVLPTLKSRGSVYFMLPYSKEVLGNFTDNKYVLEVCDNPGEIKRLQELDVDKIISYIDKIYNNMGKISRANVLNMWKHFEDIFVDKDNFDLFIKLLINRYSNKSDTNIQAIRILYKYKGFSNMKGINKKVLFETMFFKLRENAWNLTKN